MADFFGSSSNSTLGNSTNQSAGAFFGALGSSAIIFGIQVGIFILIKDNLPRLYKPRTYLLPERERPATPPKGLWRWMIPVWKTSSVDIVHKCGLDAYFFLRYLAMLIKIFVPLLLIVAPILLCVNSIGGKGETFYNEEPYVRNSVYWQEQIQSQLNILAWSNVRPDSYHRYWAHLILAVLVVAWTMYVMYDELRGFIRLRQAYLLSPQHRIRASATTVLVQALPEKWCSVEALEGLFDVYPGGIRNIWINRKYDKLLDLVKERDKLVRKLEKAETELIRKCRKGHTKQQEKDAKEQGRKASRKERKMQQEEETKRAEVLATTENETAVRSGTSFLSHQDQDRAEANIPANEDRPTSESTTNSDPPSMDTEATGTPAADPRIDKKEKQVEAYDGTYDSCNDGEPLWQKYMDAKDRPTMRLPLWGKKWLDWIPFTGPKVDVIDHCRREVAKLNQDIEEQQARPDSFPLMNSAFIQFNSQIAAHMACQSVTHHVPDQMAPRLIEISPGDVIWENMSFQWWERWLRTVLVIAIILGVIVFFAIPAAFIAALSQLQALGRKYYWLNWITKIPTEVQQGLQGVLPPALTGLLLFLIPLFMRFMSRMRGTPTGRLVELDVSDYYFAFSFFEIFIVITLAAGIFPVISTFDFAGIPNLLASYIPKASNYYFSYLILQGLSTSAGGLLQVVTLLIWFLWAPLNDSTPRQKWKRQIDLPSVSWGSFFPTFTNLACIGLIYSIIAPLIIVFNLISFTLFWFVYRYLTLYVETFKYDTGGLLFPKAINQLFTGLYVMEICLIGLFFIVESVDEGGNPVPLVCKAQAIIMIVVLALTIAYQVRLNYSFGPLFKYLPITLEDEAAERDEAFALLQRKRRGLDGEAQDEDGTQASLNEMLEERERRSAEDIEMREMPNRQAYDDGKDNVADALHRNNADNKERILYDNFATRGVLELAKKPLGVVGLAKGHLDKGFDRLQLQQRILQQRLNLQLPEGIEAGLNSHGALSDALFAGLHSSLEELSPEERDALTKEAFRHAALRARRPVIWIPQDELGIAADEIKRTQKLSPFLTISSEGAAINGKGQVVFGQSPPDFNDEDLIDL